MTTTIGRPSSFTFIVHPRTESDIFLARPLTLLRRISSDDGDFVRRALAAPPFLLGEVTVGFAPFRGELITITCLPEEALRERGRRQIGIAAEMAIERGATVLGLGALTAPATAGGARLAESVPAGVTVTNGNAFTAFVLCEQIVEAAHSTENDAACVAVVGCTGSIGSVLSQLLAARGFDLVLIGRTAERARRALGSLAANARFSGEVADAADADVVVLLANSPTARLRPDCVREGAVVIDAAEPPGASDDDVAGWGGRVTYARGGRVWIPGYRCTYDFRLGGHEVTFACLAETYLFVRDGIREHSVGVPAPAAAERMGRVARRHGVFPAPLSFHDAVPGERRERELASPR